MLQTFHGIAKSSVAEGSGVLAGTATEAGVLTLQTAAGSVDRDEATAGDTSVTHLHYMLMHCLSLVSL